MSYCQSVRTVAPRQFTHSGLLLRLAVCLCLSVRDFILSFSQRGPWNRMKTLSDGASCVDRQRGKGLTPNQKCERDTGNLLRRHVPIMQDVVHQLSFGRIDFSLALQIVVTKLSPCFFQRGTADHLLPHGDLFGVKDRLSREGKACLISVVGHREFVAVLLLEN